MSASHLPSPAPVLPDYAELQVFSHYTFLRGASAPEQLVARAAKLGYAAIAITDECTLAGVVKAHIAAKELGIHLVIGSQMTVTPEDGSPPFVLIILATNKNGYGNLSELITVARTRSEKGTYLVLPRDIAMPVGDLVHLRCLPDCQFILAPKYNASYEEVERQAAWLIQCVPGRARIALTLHHRAQDEKHRQLVSGISEEFGMPVVATGDVCMHVRSYKPLQDTMTAIRHGVPVAQCGYRLAPNAEQHLRSRVRLGNLYSREALDESVRVAQLCEFSLDELRYEYPQELVTASGRVRHLAHQVVQAGAYSSEFATSIIGQIRGFAEYGFPESHAASFALLAYASSWLKCHEPAAFLTALLNSQPMGFYSRSSLVQDACRHGVVVRPVDVSVSNWDAQLESLAKGSQPAVRLGLNNIKGLEQEAAWRIEEARAIQQFETTADLASRANLNAGHLNALASANALESLSGNRRQALWEAVASVPDKGLLRSATVIEEPVEMDAPSEAENIVADYRHLGLTLGRHPLALLRPRIAAMKFLPAEILNQFDNGRLARGCGIVTVRQRPETAKGVVFVTIEDESGNVNVICWPNLVEQQRRELMGAKLLGVYGVWQCERNVRHLVAKRLVDLSHMLGELDTRSRNFH